MRESGRAALARYAARGKQYLVMMRPSTDGRALVMQQLLYADEVRSLADVPMPDGEVREAELKLAQQLIDQIARETFDPTQYEDEVRDAHPGGHRAQGPGPGHHGSRARRRAGAGHRPDGGAEGEPG